MISRVNIYKILISNHNKNLNLCLKTRAPKYVSTVCNKLQTS